MVEHFPDLVGYKPTGSRSCSEQMTNRINLKKSLPRHIIIELLETKNRKNIESNQRKQYLSYRGKTVRKTAATLIIQTQDVEGLA